MNSNATGDLMLEDINTGEKFVLDQKEPAYSCGRKETNRIVTQSIVSSREHCIFLRACNQLHVIDSGSANGIYINGVIQEPKVMVTLKVNDIIGLGSAVTVPFSRSGSSIPTVYVLKVFEQEPLATESVDPPSDVRLPPLNGTGKNTTENKRRLSTESQDCNVPAKICKIEEKILIPVIENKRREAGCSSNSTKHCKIESQIHDIIDITDENSSDNDNIEKSHNSENGKKIIKQPDRLPTSTNYTNDDVSSSSNDISRSLLMDDDANAADVSSTSHHSPETKKSLERDNNQCRKSVISIAKSSKRKNDEELQCQPVVEKFESDKERLPKRGRRCKKKSSRDTIHPCSKYPIDNNSKNADGVDTTAKRKEKIARRRANSEESSSAEDEGIAKRGTSPERRDENSREHSDNDESLDFLLPALNLDELNVENEMQRVKEESETDEAGDSVLVQANGDQWIKYEPELDIVDVDESVYTDTSDLFDFPAPTPLRLKRVKQETKTRYSQIDVVTVSDDEDGDFFPASQLFGDELEGTVKPDPSNEDSGENDRDEFDNESNDYPDIIVLTDSEDEIDSWYNRLRLSRSNENLVSIKTEDEAPGPPEDWEDFDLVDDNEATNRCFTGNRDKSEEPIVDKGKRKKKKERSKSAKIWEMLEKERLQKLERDKLEILEKLKNFDESEKRAKGSNVRKVSNEESSGNKEREDISPKKTRKTKSTKHDKGRSSGEAKSEDGKSTEKNVEKSRSVSTEKPQSISMEALGSVSTEKLKSIPTEKSRSFSWEESGSIPTAKTGSISTEKSKSIPTERSVSAEKSGSISTEKSKLISTEKSKSISTERSRSVSAEKSGSIVTEKLGTISAEKSKLIPTEKSRSICTEKSGSTEKPGYISADKSRTIAEKSRSISTEKSKSILSEKPGATSGQFSSSIITEKSRSISTEKSRSNMSESSLTTSIERPVVVATKIDQVMRGQQLVEASFLAQDEKRGVSRGIKKGERSTDREEATTSGVSQNSRINDHDVESTSPATTKQPSTNSTTRKSHIKLTTKQSGPKLSAKQTRELALKAKQEETLHMREQKRRRMINKWADCLPPRKHQGPSLTRKEKEEIKNDRKEKLKRIADEKKKAAENNDATELKRPSIKAIAKITEKTRNDFLVNDIEDRIGRPADIEDTTLANGVKLSDEVKRRDTLLDVINDNLTNGETSMKNCDNSTKGTRRKDQSLDLENVNPASTDTNVVVGTSNVKPLSHQFKTSLLIEPRSQDPCSRTTKEKSKSKTISARLIQNPKGPCEVERVAGKSLTNDTSGTSNNRRDTRTTVSQSSMKSLLKKNPPGMTTCEVLKRVSFDDSMKKVRVYEIEPGNTLKKCPTTDAPMGSKKTSNKRTMDKTACPQLEQFLLRIFGWNPIWLEEQKHCDMPPPIVDLKTLIPMLTKYNSYEVYYKVTEPLLALELWYQMSRDVDIGEKNSNRNRVMCSIVNNSFSLQTIPSKNLRVTTLMLEVVVTKREMDLQLHPVYGDLIFFEYASNSRGKQSFSTVFAYVQNVRRTVITNLTYFNRDLVNYVKDAYALLSYEVMTKPLDHTNIQTNRPHRMRKISYLRSNMRMIQSLQYLPISPLLNHILHPTVEDYQLPTVNNANAYTLVTKDNLNEKQLEAVLRVTEAVVLKQPKICLIQGPPGTGKSKVIVNLVNEILYGGGRYKKKKMRILLCAPSNAAIDEIVLRLLDVRKSISEPMSRFKMVRIGRAETMHPLAKNVSLSVLAKKDIKTTTENYMSPTFTNDSVEQEKQLMTAQINSLKLKLSDARKTGAAEANYLAKLLCELSTKYELLNNRRPVERIDPKELAKLQRGAEHTLLMGADVIACTLASCYTGMMESIFSESGQEISVCIVDEATQCAEAETLIPLMLGVRTLVLVGDTNQLPATIISQKAKEYGLDQSLFARIQHSFEGPENNPIIQLNTQYRMSYAVAHWPNRFFYGGTLKNAANMRNLPFYLYKVIDLDSIQNNDKFSNTDEASFVANLLCTMMSRSKLANINGTIKVGIITPYNNQKTMIINKIKECISPLPDNVRTKFVYEVNTVDSFQGQERDVIIMSCVRSSGIGFLSDRQRLCVALTRAKHSLILCGNFKTFERDPMWNALLSDAKSRGVYTKVKATATSDEIKQCVVR